jgi:copper chaperone
MRKVTLRIENMHCGACVRRVTQTLEKTGAQVEEVRIGAARLQAPETLEDATLLQSLDKAGYHAMVEAVQA